MAFDGQKNAFTVTDQVLGAFLRLVFWCCAVVFCGAWASIEAAGGVLTVHPLYNPHGGKTTGGTRTLSAKLTEERTPKAGGGGKGACLPMVTDWLVD